MVLNNWSGSDADWMGVHRAARRQERLAFLLAAVAFAAALGLFVYSRFAPFLHQIATLSGFVHS